MCISVNKNATFGSGKWLSVILAIKNEIMMENMDELLQLNSSINTSGLIMPHMKLTVCGR